MVSYKIKENCMFSSKKKKKMYVCISTVFC